MRAWAGMLLAGWIIVSGAWAQNLPRPSMAAELRGRVVDEAGAPVAGAVVVARWNWQVYVSRFEGSGWYNQPEAIHIDEALTDRDGRYVIGGWGPAVRPGRPDPDSPAILVFKAEFEPSSGRNANVTLRKVADSAGYAKRVRAFQETSLRWQVPAQATPRMVEALYREKRRLGEPGFDILGPNMLPGRSGAGRLVDARTGQRPRWNPVIGIDWTLKRSDGAPGTRRFVQTKYGGTEGDSASFYVSPWRLPHPDVPGWEPDPAREPDVTIYVRGYRIAHAERWPEDGATIQLTPLDDSRDATLANLRETRRDIDRALAQGDRATALAGQRVLLQSFAYDCRQLTPDVQKGLCFEPQSDVAQFVERPGAVASHPIETLEGTRTMRIIAINSPTARAASAMAPSGLYIQREPVKGFSIEVAK